MARNLWRVVYMSDIGALGNSKVWAIKATGINLEALALPKWTSIYYSRFRGREFMKLMSEQWEQLGASGSLCQYLGRNMTHVTEVKCVHGFIVIREEKLGLFKFLALARVSLDDHRQAGSNPQSHSQWAIVQLHYKSKVFKNINKKVCEFAFSQKFESHVWYIWIHICDFLKVMWKFERDLPYRFCRVKWFWHGKRWY